MDGPITAWGWSTEVGNPALRTLRSRSIAAHATERSPHANQVLCRACECGSVAVIEISGRFVASQTRHYYAAVAAFVRHKRRDTLESA